LIFPTQMRVSVPEDVLFRQLEHEAVILNLKSESYFGLNDVGTRMWAVLTTSESVQVAYEQLLQEYEIDPSTLHRDLQKLIDQLSDYGLVQISSQV
jgi:hypothetical protein